VRAKTRRELNGATEKIVVMFDRLAGRDTDADLQRAS
jgi:hypothetical protein